MEDEDGSVPAGNRGVEVRIILILSVCVLLLYLLMRVFLHSGGLLLFLSGGIAVILMEAVFVSWVYKRNLGAGAEGRSEPERFPDTEYRRIARRAGMALGGREYSRELIMKELWSMLIERASIKMSIRQSELRAMLEDSRGTEFGDTERAEMLRKYHLMSKNHFARQTDGLPLKQELNSFFDEIENY
jgi:hypothetical protein